MLLHARIAALGLMLALGARAAPEALPAAAPRPDAGATSTQDAPAHPAAPAPESPALAPPLKPAPDAPLALTAIPGAQAAPAAIPGAQAAPAADEAVGLAGANVDAIRTASAPDAWGGVQDPNGPQLSQRVASYDLRAVLDPKAHTVEGTEVLRWKNRSAVPVRTLYFHLYLNAFEGPRSTWMTEKAISGVFRSGVEIKKGEWGWIDVLEVKQGDKSATLSFVHPDGGPETDRTVLRAELPEAVAAGATTELRLRFHDQLPRVIARTGYFGSYHLVAQWFPKIGVLELPGERGATAPRWNVHEFHLNSEFYADFGNYDLEIVAPKGFTVAATGERVGEAKDTTDGVLHHFHQDDIHDAVFTAWDGYAPPLSGTYQGPGSPTVTVETYYPPEYLDSARISHQATLDSLKYFSETLGPYPYRHVTVVVPPYNAGESGGMEYETFFTSDGTNGFGAGYTRFVAVHEFGHGYFMGLLATNEFEEPYLDEGMNEFWDDRMLDREQAQFDLGLLGKIGFNPPPLDYWDLERIARGPATFAPDPVVASSWKRYSNGSYVSIYQRTALIFHDLEVELGSAVFARGMKLYYQRWHHRHPSTADLRDALLDGCEKPQDKQLVQEWFDTQIYGAVPVDDAVVSIESEELVPEPGTVLQDGKRVEIDEEMAAEETKTARAAFAAAQADAGTESAQSNAQMTDKTKVAIGSDKEPGMDFKPGAFPYRSVVKAQRRGLQLAQTLLVKFEDGRSETISWPPGEPWHRWVFEGAARVQSAQLDPERQLLLDVNKLDDGRAREGSALAAHRWALEVGHWLELLFALVGGL